MGPVLSSHERRRQGGYVPWAVACVPPCYGPGECESMSSATRPERHQIVWMPVRLKQVRANWAVG